MPSSVHRRAFPRFVLGALCAFLSLLAGSAFAQSGGGVIAGRVTNQATREPLWNASVSVRGTNLMAVTDRDGAYRITGVPEGTQTVTASYTGLDDMQAAVSVRSGATVTQDLALTAGYYELDKVVVKSIKEGQSLAIQQQKLATNSKVVSALDA